MEWQKENFLISTDKGKLDIPYIHRFLSQDSYWAEGIPIDIIRTSIQNSLCFGVYVYDQQIGFARIVTDEATFGYLADVFIDPNFRGNGLSKWLMQVIVDYPSLQRLRRLLLVTKDAHGLYEQFGFMVVQNPERFMNIHRPGIYKNADPVIEKG